MPSDDPADTFEVVQARELTRAEVNKVISALWRVGSPYGYYVCKAAGWTSLAALLLSAAAFIQLLNQVAPLGVSFPLWGVLGLLVGGLSFPLSMIMAARWAISARRQQFMYRHRFSIRPDGLMATVKDIQC